MYSYLMGAAPPGAASLVVFAMSVQSATCADASRQRDGTGGEERSQTLRRNAYWTADKAVKS